MFQRRSLGLEELGARILPSATPLPSINPGGPAIFPPVPPPYHHTLGGGGYGQYSADAVTSGAGPQYNLQGTAEVRGMGKVDVSGNLHGVGFIQQGRAGGELTFSNSHGSVTVELQGPPQPGFSPLPQRFSYTVVSGTGAYEHLSGHGSLTLTLHAQPTTGATGPHGTFTLTL